MAKQLRLTQPKAIALANLHHAQAGEKLNTKAPMAKQACRTETTNTSLMRSDDKPVAKLSLDRTRKIVTTQAH